MYIHSTFYMYLQLNPVIDTLTEKIIILPYYMDPNEND